MAGYADGSTIQSRMRLELALLRLQAFAKWLDRREPILKRDTDA
jgi:hypothetical protein